MNKIINLVFEGAREEILRQVDFDSFTNENGEVIEEVFDLVEAAIAVAYEKGFKDALSIEK